MYLAFWGGINALNLPGGLYRRKKGTAIGISPMFETELFLSNLLLDVMITPLCVTR